MKKFFIIILAICSFSLFNLTACFEENTTDEVQHYTIGESFYFDDLEITVNDYTVEQTYIYENMFEADKGFDWAIVNVSITNKTNTVKNLEESLLFNTSRIYQTKFIYNDDYTYSSTFFTVMGTYIPDIFIRAYSSIEPLATISGIYAFKIPESISSNGKHEFIFKFNDSSDKRACSVLLREDSLDANLGGDI